MAFLLLTESKLKNWTVKYGREERVQHLMNQYRTFVSKNKIFQGPNSIERYFAFLTRLE